jgi:hypothetical protein
MAVGGTTFATQKQLDKFFDFLQKRIFILEEEMDKVKQKLPAIFEPTPIDWKEMGYTNNELKKIIPKKWIKEFDLWICGQTCAVRPDGEVITYKHDVERFLDLKKTGRKESPLEWD